MGPAAGRRWMSLTLQAKLKIGFGLLLLLALANGLFSFTQIRSIFKRTDYLARSVVLKQTTVQRLQAAVKAYGGAVTGIRGGQEEAAAERVKAAQADLDTTLQELRALTGSPEEGRLVAEVSASAQDLRVLGSEVVRLRLQEGGTARGYQTRLAALTRFIGENIQHRLKPVLGDPSRYEPKFLERLRALFSGQQITSTDLTRYQSSVEMQIALADMGAAVTAHVARPEPTFQAKIEAAEAAWEKALGTYRSVEGPEEQILAARLLEQFRGLRAARERLLFLQREGEGRQRAFRAALGGLSGLLERGLDTIAGEALQELGAVNRRVQGVLNLAFLLLGASLLIAMAAGIVIYRSISRPIRDLLAATGTVASGIFRQIPVAGDDEVGHLTKAFNAMTHSLRQRDIRLRVQQQQLKRANTQLAEANLHKSEFLASMSHELRTPLHAIMGFAEILRESPPGPLKAEQRAYLEHIAASGHHLLGLINEVLDLAKVESGRIELSPEAFPLSDVLQGLHALIRSLADKKNIKIEFAVAPDVRTVTADPGRFRQIMYNLLSNAIKFTPTGGQIRVGVRWATEVRPNDCVQVEVADTGIGIRREDQDRIFEEFIQVRGGQALEGTGLGLALTRKFVELHGGRIWVESEMGRGSTFIFRLPQPLRLRTAPSPPAAPSPKTPAVVERPVPSEPSERGALVLGEEGAATTGLRAALLATGFDTALLAPPAELADFGREVELTLVACPPAVFRAEGRLILAELRSRAALQEVPLLILEPDGAGTSNALRVALALLSALRGLPAGGGGPHTFLIAADDPHFAQAVRGSLSGGENLVVEAEEGEFAAVAGEKQPNLLVADVTASATVLRLVQRLGKDPQTRGLPLLVLPPPPLWPEKPPPDPGGVAPAHRVGSE